MKNTENAKKVYEVTLFTKKGDKTVENAIRISANDYTDALNLAKTAYPDRKIAVLAVVTDVDGWARLATQTLRRYERWERRNNFAVMNPWKRSDTDRADLIQEAIADAIAKHGLTPECNMWTVADVMMDTFRRVAQAHTRISEAVYLPGWSICNLETPEPRPTYPELDALVRRAMRIASLTAEQMEVLEYRCEGKTFQDIADLRGVSNKAVQFAYKKALYNVLSAMTDIDPDFSIITDPDGNGGNDGITADDIAEAFEKLMRAKKSKK